MKFLFHSRKRSDGDADFQIYPEVNKVNTQGNLSTKSFPGIFALLSSLDFKYINTVSFILSLRNFGRTSSK